MVHYITITYAANNLKIITICYCLHTEFSSTYYNDKGNVFRNIFGQYIKPHMNEIDNPTLIQEWKLNLDTV